jgi:NAD(P)-dependent dehydrogenase (short-subunit alcohol dehydrogenase family)
MTQKTLIVTGAASGIGHAIFLLAKDRGYRVVTIDLAESIDGQDPAHHVVGNLLESATHDEAVRVAKSGPGGDGTIYGLVNNAGISPPYGPALDISVERWEQLFAINVGVVFRLSQRVGREMIAAGSGAIVNTSSLAGLSGLAGAADYSATKHAVIGLTKSLAIEWAEFGVRVNALCPGLTATEAAKSAVNATDKGLFERRARGVPLGRIAEPEDQAKGALFLLSEDASYISGTTLVVDGATFAQHPGYAKH